MNHVLPISPSVFRTCGDVIVPKDELLCYSAAHADVHLSQQLGSCLAPAVILWKHRHLKHGTVYQKKTKNPPAEIRTILQNCNKSSHGPELVLEA